MCLEEFLRKTHKKGQIHNYIQKAYEKARHRGEEEDEEVLEEFLEAWANNVQPQGQVMLAATYLSRYNDKYYGLRVLMTHPFRKMEELLRPELDLVPPHLHYQTLAFLVQKERWTNEAAIRADLELEAFREHHIRNITTMLFANQSLMEKYIDGTLDKKDDAPEAEWQQDGQTGDEQAPQLSQQQQNIVQELVTSVQAGMKQRAGREDAWKGEDPEETETEEAAHAWPAGMGLAPQAVARSRPCIRPPRNVCYSQHPLATMREKFPERNFILIEVLAFLR